MRFFKYFFFLLSYAISLSANAQSFEGMIAYDIVYESKASPQEKQQYADVMGTRHEFYIKGGHYKSVFNGSFMKMYIYKPEDKRSYKLTSKSDTLYWEDYSQSKDEPISASLQKNREKILGYDCEVLVVTSKKTKTTYYFNRQFVIDPKDYEGHKYANWHYFILQSKAVPLKVITETDEFVFTSVATEIKPMKLKDSFF